MTRARCLIRRALAVCAVITLLVGAIQIVSQIGPDFWAWVEVGQREATAFERFSTSYAPGEFLSVSASVQVEDGQCSSNVAAKFSGPSNSFDQDLRAKRGECGLGPIGFAALVSICILAWTRRSQPDERQRPKHWLARAAVLLAATSGIGGLFSFCSLLGVRANGGVLLSSERADNRLAEEPVGSLWEGVADVRVDWSFVDGGVQFELSAIRFTGWHVQYYDGDPDLAFFQLPAVERSQRYLGGGRFLADGFTLRAGGWLPSVLAIIATYFVIRAAIRRRRYLREGLCSYCSYDLTGNVSGRCPECGRPIGAPRMT